MSGLSASEHRTGSDAQRGRKSIERATAALIAILIHLPLLYLFVFEPAPRPSQDQESQGPPEETLQAFLVTYPASPFSEAAPPVVRPRLMVPRESLPPMPEIDVPVEAPTAEVMATTAGSASHHAAVRVPTLARPSAPRPAEIPSRGHSEGPGRHGESSGGVGIARSVLPRYPRLSVWLRQQGTTTVSVTIDSRGHPKSVRVLHSSGHFLLDRSAVQAVRQWIFRPSTNGKDEITLQIGFHLVPPVAVHFPTIIVPYDAALVARINAAATRAQHVPPSLTASEDAVRRMAQALRSVGRPTPGVGDDLRKRRELIDRGRVLSVKLLGTVTRGLNVDFDQAERARGVDAPENRKLLWYAFVVRQERGTSEWLLGTASGSIRRVEVLTGGPACSAGCAGEL